MDAHSRLRKRLQDSSVRVAAGSGEGVGGGFTIFQSLPSIWGGLRFDGFYVLSLLSLLRLLRGTFTGTFYYVF
jgi:hypothetical protein